MADENITTTEYIEVEINSLELVEFMEELSTLQVVNTNLINESSQKELDIPIISNQIKQEPNNYTEDYYEEPVFDPIEEQEIVYADDNNTIENNCMDFDQSFCKTESYFEEDEPESTCFYAEDIDKNNLKHGIK